MSTMQIEEELDDDGEVRRIATWRDAEGSKLRVAIVADKVLVSTSKNWWVELDETQAAELDAFLATRRRVAKDVTVDPPKPKRSAVLVDSAEAAIVVEHIIGTLATIDRVEGLFEHLKVVLSDEAVYEHLRTCGDVIDDEDDRARMRDLAEFFADQFCQGKRS